MTNPPAGQDAQNGYLSFAKMLGRAMGQMALYGVKHPSVIESLGEAHKLIGALAARAGGEATLALDGANVLGNGKVVFTADKLPSSLAGVLRRFNIASISFASAATREELVSFCELSMVKQDARNFSPAEFLKDRNVSGIRANATVYARIDKGQKVVSGGTAEGTGTGGAGPGGGSGAGSGSGPGGASGDGSGGGQMTLEKQISGKTLEDSLAAIVGQLDIGDEERANIMRVVIAQMQQELELRVQTVTEQVRGEKMKMENAQTRTESVMASAAEGVVMVDRQGRVMMMNSAAEEIFGGKLAAMSGKPIGDIKREHQVLSISQKLDAPPDRESARQVSVSGGADEVRLMRQSTAIIKNDDGQIVGSIAVTPETAKLREYDRLQKEFVANVTHELRSPLTSITAALAILNANLSNIGEENKKFLNTAVRNAHRLNSLINDILDFSKLQSGKLTVKPEVCEPLAIMNEAADSVQAWARSKNVTVTSGGSAGERLVAADKPRTVQILLNLFSNALKFTPAGGKIEVVAGVETKARKEYVTFTVKDTGPGIAKQDQEKIFERFIQIAGGENVGGTGLGLPITKALVVMQNGYIEVESEPGKGAAFKVALPAVSAGQDAPRVMDFAPAPEKKSWWSRLFGK